MKTEITYEAFQALTATFQLLHSLELLDDHEVLISWEKRPSVVIDGDFIKILDDDEEGLYGAIIELMKPYAMVETAAKRYSIIYPSEIKHR